jgi:hypothetical protein
VYDVVVVDDEIGSCTVAESLGAELDRARDHKRPTDHRHPMYCYCKHLDYPVIAR